MIPLSLKAPFEVKFSKPDYEMIKFVVRDLNLDKTWLTPEKIIFMTNETSGIQIECDAVFDLYVTTSPLIMGVIPASMMPNIIAMICAVIIACWTVKLYNFQ